MTAVDVISWTLGGVHLMTRADRCLRKIATACQRQCSSPATFRGATIVGEQEAGAGEQSLTFWLGSETRMLGRQPRGLTLAQIELDI